MSVGQVSALGAFLFFFALALADRSMIGLAGIMGLSILINPNRFSDSQILFRRIFASPYLPFVTVALLAAPFQENVTEMLWLASIPLSYVVARLIRYMASSSALAFGIAGVGLVLETVRVASLTELGKAIPILVKLTDYHHKNGIAWMVALGIVGVASLMISSRFRGLSAWFRGVGFVTLGVLLLLSDSVTAIIAGAIGTLTLAFVPMQRDFLLKNRAVVMGVSAAAIVLSGALVLANLLFPNVSFLSPLRRESNLTGRTGIWDCYLSEVFSSPDEATNGALSCRIGNLHSSFLEAHLNGGWPLALALLFGFVSAIFVAARRVRQVLDGPKVGDELFALGVAVVGFIIALVESYVFSGFVYMSIVLFLGPSLNDLKGGRPRFWRTRTE